MPIPTAENALVAEDKLRAYLLNVSHPVGGPKARWFRSLGYDDASIANLTEDLLSIARTVEPSMEETTPYGTKYVVCGTLQSPSGHRAAVRTVWIVEHDDPRPRLVTAYPDKQGSENE